MVRSKRSDAGVASASRGGSGRSVVVAPSRRFGTIQHPDWRSRSTARRSQYPRIQLANLLYGGFFSSRLVENIREDKGYTYTPASRIVHGSAGSTLVVEADVATEDTAPAPLEMWYEVGRLSTLRPTDEELEDVRQFVIGTLTMSVATATGLASTLATLIGVGLDVT